MTTPTPLLSRISLACEQLDVAIELFFAERSYVAALTLAGAAEEILGDALKAGGQPHALALRFNLRQRALERARFPKPVFEDFRNRQNYARNAAKHMGERSRRHEDQYFRADPQKAATDMILRAMHNQKLLSIPETDQRSRFLAWHMASVYGTD